VLSRCPALVALQGSAYATLPRSLSGRRELLAAWVWLASATPLNVVHWLTAIGAKTDGGFAEEMLLGHSWGIKVRHGISG